MTEIGDKRLSIIGLGSIGRILIARLIASGVPAANLSLCDLDRARAETLAAEHGARQATLEDEQICRAEMLLIATPPKAVADVLNILFPRLQAGQILVSFAAAVSLRWLEERVPPGVAIVRVMPNAASMVGRGMNMVAYGRSATPEARALVGALLQGLGDSLEVQDGQMNWCVGLSGAAMRSLLPALEGMTQAGIEAGLPEDGARRVAAQVMLGTAALVVQTHLTFDEIKALTPMQTVDEAVMAKLFLEAARAAREKTDGLQRKILEG